MPYAETPEAPTWAPQGTQVIEPRIIGAVPGDEKRKSAARVDKDLEIVLDIHIPFTKNRRIQSSTRRERPPLPDRVARPILEARRRPPVVNQPYPPAIHARRTPVPLPPPEPVHVEPRPMVRPLQPTSPIRSRRPSDEEVLTPLRIGRDHRRRASRARSPARRDISARRQSRLEARLRELEEELKEEQADSRRESILRRCAEIKEARAHHHMERVQERERERRHQEAERQAFERERRERLERISHRPVDIHTVGPGGIGDRGDQVLAEAILRGRQAEQIVRATRTPQEVPVMGEYRRRGTERRTWDDDRWRAGRRRT